MADGTLPYWGVIIGAIVGAVLGDTVSYWIGRRYGDAVGEVGDRAIGSARSAVLVFARLVVFGIAGVAWTAWHARKKG